jgi:hypothetical protein
MSMNIVVVHAMQTFPPSMVEKLAPRPWKTLQPDLPMLLLQKWDVWIVLVSPLAVR